MDLTELNGIIEALEGERDATSSNHKRLTELVIKALNAIKPFLDGVKTPVNAFSGAIDPEKVSTTLDPSLSVPIEAARKIKDIRKQRRVNGLA